MPELEIPAEHQRGLAKLHGLSSERAGELLAAIQLAARKADTDRISPSGIPDIPGLPPRDKEEIFETVLSLYRVRTKAEVSIEEFITDISDFLQSPESTEFQITTEEAGKLADRLKEFLSIDALNFFAKATIPRYEHERTLHDLRILTDARPVFGEDPSGSPEAAVIFHMLKIAYHQSNRIEEIFFSLDENDLDYLKEMVLRAELKAKSLQNALSAGHIKVIHEA